MTIDTREELIAALHTAAELEHGLMLQYLFPALSLKKRADEGLTPHQLALTRRWEGVILGVAVEEMGHLGTVCNLLAAIGDGPRFQRPNFPQAIGYYPFPFDLIGFGDEALYRMLVFELPRGAPMPDPPHERALPRLAFAESIGPDPLEYDYVGELYAKISDGFNNVAETELFIGNPQAQADDTWSVTLDLRPVLNRQSAIEAIDDIIIDGEGSPSGTSNSHYQRFRTIRTEYAQAEYFDAARPVVRNPRTREHPGLAGPGSMLTDEIALPVAELFNEVYATTLLCLQQFFAFGGETAAQRAVLKDTAGRLMSVAVRPIAEVLTDLPAFAGNSDDRAGPPFELYDAVTVSPHLPARWTILLERFKLCSDAAVQLGAEVPRLAAIGETLSLLRRTIAAVAT